jgi:hypothetical protein
MLSVRIVAALPGESAVSESAVSESAISEPPFQRSPGRAGIVLCMKVPIAHTRLGTLQTAPYLSMKMLLKIVFALPGESAVSESAINEPPFQRSPGRAGIVLCMKVPIAHTRLGTLQTAPYFFYENVIKNCIRSTRRVCNQRVCFQRTSFSALAG